jgi:hypothetical protein
MSPLAVVRELRATQVRAGRMYHADVVDPSLPGKCRSPSVRAVDDAPSGGVTTVRLRKRESSRSG